MDKLAVPQNRDCWICFNSENNITLTTVNSENILKNCATYLDTSIIINHFDSELLVSCCSYCYESAHQLTLLEEQVEKLQKEISDLGVIFSKYVLERRSLLENKKEISPTKNPTLPKEKCIAINKNPDHCSIAPIESNIILKEEVFEITPKDFPLDCQGEMGTDDPLLSEDGFENVNNNNRDRVNVISSQNDIADDTDEESSLKVDPTVKNLIVPDQQMSAANKDSGGQQIVIYIADLVKCLKMPVVQLKRIQPCKTGKPTIVVNKTSCNKKLQINDPKKCSASTNSDYPNEDIPDPTFLPKNQENSRPTYNIPLNVSVIAGGETVKCENDIDNNKPYECSICGQGFLKLCDLEDHDKLHNKERTTSRNLTANEIIGDKQFKCSICPKSFKSALLLKSHKKFHSKKRSFKCSFCSKSFSSSCDARKHEMIHTGERPYNCSFCDKSFNQLSAARKHERIHTGERPYKCSFCHKSFNQSGAARRHEKIHTGERPYKCSCCEKTFQRRSHLKVHEKFHSGDDPYKCSSCPTSFINARDLQNHESVHTTNERMYKCSFCPKSFESVHLLKRHEKSHTSKRPFKCSSCEMTFKLNQHLELHLERKHGNTTEEFILP